MTYSQPYAGPPLPTKTSGLSIAALIVGIAAFVFGLVPFFGLLLALVGLLLAIIALTKPGSKVMPVIGLIGSILGALANIVVLIFIFTLQPTPLTDVDDDRDDSSEQQESDEPDNADELTLVTVETPCFTFEAPQEFINNQSSDEDELCFATREGWGEMDDGGTITYTGVGAVWDQVLVEPVRVETTNTMAPDGELDTLVDYLETNYFPDLGAVISLREPVTLDGLEANLTRIDSPAESTVTKATIVVKAEQPYETANGPVQFFLITFVIDDERGDEIIDALVDSWRWN